MKLIIVAVGHKMPEWISQGFNEYRKRMPREATITLLELKPEPRTTGKTVPQMMEAEAQRIEAAIPKNACRVVLDERGAALTTQQLALKMQDWQGAGQAIAFVIGGADGLHESIRRSANVLLALSALTLPHGMVRVLLAEQLYRAHSLLNNHPYHRE